MPRDITAVLEIVRPMFIGDGHQDANAIRPPSVKGALRFWWRALHWAPHLQAADGNVKKALQSLHTEEGLLFGAVARKQNGHQTGGQGRYLLRIPDARRQGQNVKLSQNSGLSYIGLGLFELGQQSDRNAIPAGDRFTVRLIERPRCGITDEQRAGMRATLRAWGTFGGLGSRARRGFGSVALRELDGEPIPEATPGDYLNQARAIIAHGKFAPGMPPFTAFSCDSEVERFATSPNAAKAHEALGQQYKQARDNKEGKITYGDKMALGLPLAKYEPDLRRAGPLFMHVHPVAGGQYIATVLYLPAEFHSERRISIEPAKRFMDLAESKPVSGA